MSAELFRRAYEEDDINLFRKWIDDLEAVIAEREARIRELEETIRVQRDLSYLQNKQLKQRLEELEAGATVQAYTPVDAPLEFTETPGEYVPISKATEAQMRLRKAMLQIDAATIADWEATEQALRDAAVGIFEDGAKHLHLPREVHNSDAEQNSN
jgi:hypothetical protein